MTIRHKTQVYIDPRCDTPEFRRMLQQQRPDIQIMGRWPRQSARTELTPIGEQYIIPGCGLWDHK